MTLFERSAFAELLDMMAEDPRNAP